MAQRNGFEVEAGSQQLTVLAHSASSTAQAGAWPKRRPKAGAGSRS